MKFEEIQKAIDEEKELEILNYNVSWDWQDFKYNEFIGIKPEHIFSSKYRLKKVKIKKYQVLYKNAFGTYFLSDKRYATIREFQIEHEIANYHPGLSWGRGPHGIYAARLVEETVEEFDE